MTPLTRIVVGVSRGRACAASAKASLRARRTTDALGLGVAAASVVLVAPSVGQSSNLPVDRQRAGVRIQAEQHAGRPGPLDLDSRRVRLGVELRRHGLREWAAPDLYVL